MNNHGPLIPPQRIRLAVLLLGCLLQPSVTGQEPPPAAAPRIPHLLRVADGVFSGAQPRDERDFAALARMGVNTIVSVDGVRPNIEAAQKHGLRYVHIPFGYDQIDDRAERSLTRVARDSIGPLYVHCHHGKHRGPAAAAIICLAAGNFHQAEAMDFLKRAGTSQNYSGLWHSIKTFRTPPADAVLPELVAIAEVDDLTAWMARMDREFDDLQVAQTAQWRVPDAGPEGAPVQQALQLRESLRESLRQLDAAQMAAFGDAMRQAESAADKLVTAINAQDTVAADKLFQSISQSCTACHAEHRN